MSFEDNLNKILEKYADLGAKLSDAGGLNRDDFVQFSKEYAELTVIVAYINKLHDIQSEIIDLTEITCDVSNDKDMIQMAEDELRSLKQQLPEIERQVKLSLLPKDTADEKNAILEVRAGTGGDEAALFASVLFRMYHRYAERKNWKFEILSYSETGIGGYKDASAIISGKDVFSKLKFESGVHRVQRVPETESSGRVHTSAATVAVLPEAEEVDVVIEDKDLRIDVFRAGGPGGQSVNTTDSAVRIVHLPTGIVVQQQDEKSQHKNKAKALKILRSRIYDAERAAKDKERSDMRAGQVGSGDRSERIRTYNFPQGRVTDHRINLTLYKITNVVDEGDLDDFIEALIAEDEAKRLSEVI